MTEALLRLLLVEDDTVSRQFLVEALRALPAEVDAASSIAHACELAATHQHSLWLVDAHLPDGDGVACLARLRTVDTSTPAIAVTADRWREEFDRLEAGGFVEVLQKPISIQALQANVRRLAGLGAQAIADTPAPRCGKRPVWDEARALRAMAGNRVSWLALGQVFLEELHQVREQIGRAHEAGDASTMHALLHRLSASCGFVGAARLAGTLPALSESPLDAQAWQNFNHAVEDTLATPLPQS